MTIFYTAHEARTYARNRGWVRSQGEGWTSHFNLDTIMRKIAAATVGGEAVLLRADDGIVLYRWSFATGKVSRTTYKPESYQARLHWQAAKHERDLTFA